MALAQKRESLLPFSEAPCVELNVVVCISPFRVCSFVEEGRETLHKKKRQRVTLSDCCIPVPNVRDAPRFAV
jgi:hypothetical protein